MTAAQLTEWDKVLAEYVINDIAGLETLTTCCQALDRAEALRKQIDKDGEVVKARASSKSIPALSQN